LNVLRSVSIANALTFTEASQAVGKRIAEGKPNRLEKPGNHDASPHRRPFSLLPDPAP
jgi:hypothetical protein